jgi:hypothetical protein
MARVGDPNPSGGQAGGIGRPEIRERRGGRMAGDSKVTAAEIDDADRRAPDKLLAIADEVIE